MDQRFVAFVEYAGWYQVFLPSLNGPASGWIQASVDAAIDVMQVNDPVRGKQGVSVHPVASASASLLSYVWDKQWLPKLSQSAGDNVCSANWYKVPVIPVEGSTAGWVCGNYLLSHQPQVTSPKINLSGGFEFTLTGLFSGTLRVEYSDDLKTWTDLTLPLVTALPAVLRDDRPVSAKQRYYRVVTSP